MGVIAELPEAENELDFLTKIKAVFRLDIIRHTNLLNKKIKKVALCGGSGSSLVHAAIAAEPRPVHIPRERPPMVEADEGPLVLVETRKDLSQIKLPFESDHPAQPHV